MQVVQQSRIVTSAEWRALIGGPVQTRRKELGLSLRGAGDIAGFSEGLWRQIESGERVIAKGVVELVNPKPASLLGLCYALGWTADSIDRLASGGEPVLVGSNPESTDATFARLRAHAARADRRIAALTRQVALLTRYSNLRADELESDLDEM